jgi:hypothetical protein
MRTLEQRLRIANRDPIKIPVDPKVSAEMRDRILKQRRIGSTDLAKYAVFLKDDRSGIVKIFPDERCLSKSVISASPLCQKGILLSSFFNFRARAYGDQIYHDIYFDKDRLTSESFFTQGVFVEIGDAAIEDVSADHAALKYLIDLSAAKDPKTAAEQAKQFKEGTNLSGYRYADSVTPRENTTYGFRTIAYKLENTIAPYNPETTMTELMFLSLAFDKRVDLIGTFRILGRDEYGGLTIVWKELSRRDAPKIKFSKDQPLRDFKPRQNY